MFDTIKLNLEAAIESKDITMFELAKAQLTKEVQAELSNDQMTELVVLIGIFRKIKFNNL